MEAHDLLWNLFGFGRFHFQEVLVQRFVISVPPLEHEIPVDLLKNSLKVFEECLSDVRTHSLQDLPHFGLEFVGDVPGTWRLLARADVVGVINLLLDIFASDDANALRILFGRWLRLVAVEARKSFLL